ncbi:hypothetical protein STEG23_023908, partial [Scotinomys teguina]
LQKKSENLKTKWNALNNALKADWEGGSRTCKMISSQRYRHGRGEHPLLRRGLIKSTKDQTSYYILIRLALISLMTD